jgi:6-phosphogluconate dehydrogenase
MSNADIGLIGLAVMGANLARNIERNGYTVAVFNRTRSVTEEFIQEYKQHKFVDTADIVSFVEALSRPRKIILMVQAGVAVDSCIAQLLPLLSPGDIIIDGGNSHFKHTEARQALCLEKEIDFLGVGVSGGEEGALLGPSIMPGGNEKACRNILGLLEKISAKVDGPCTSYIGAGGSGHFVKMVHNGIEYGDMQLIAEVYDLLRRISGYTPDKLSVLFDKWNQGTLKSFLIEITSKIFLKRAEDGGFLVDKILDKAAQKGTGRWTIEAGLELGVPIPTIAAAVDARALSFRKSEREQASREIVVSHTPSSEVEVENFDKLCEDALFAAKLIAYSQGMDLLKVASDTYNWGLNLSELCRIWKGGCIIRADFLDQLQKAFAKNPTQHILRIPELGAKLLPRLNSLRKVLAISAQNGIPIPALSSALGYFDSYRTANLPQNLTQAQRDFFGAHTYERVDQPGVFHTVWE